MKNSFWTLLEEEEARASACRDDRMADSRVVAARYDKVSCVHKEHLMVCTEVGDRLLREWCATRAIRAFWRIDDPDPARLTAIVGVASEDWDWWDPVVRKRSRQWGRPRLKA